MLFMFTKNQIEAGRNEAGGGKKKDEWKGLPFSLQDSTMSQHFSKVIMCSLDLKS
jgi:hypothetical protein